METVIILIGLVSTCYFIRNKHFKRPIHIHIKHS